MFVCICLLVSKIQPEQGKHYKFDRFHSLFLVPDELIQNQVPNLTNNAVLRLNEHLCAGGEIGKDSCKVKARQVLITECNNFVPGRLWRPPPGPPEFGASLHGGGRGVGRH